MWFLTSSVLFFLLVFLYSLFTFPCPPPVADDMAMIFRGRFISKATSSFHLKKKYFADSVALPFRVVGVGFEEPHLRLMF